MEWKEFLLGVIEAVSWPIVVVFVLIALKDDVPEFLKKLSEKLKTAKFKGAELHFTSQVQPKTVAEIPAAPEEINSRRSIILP